jgi:hypothetical protein
MTDNDYKEIEAEVANWECPTCGNEVWYKYNIGEYYCSLNHRSPQDLQPKNKEYLIKPEIQQKIKENHKMKNEMAWKEIREQRQESSNKNMSLFLKWAKDKITVSFDSESKKLEFFNPGSDEKIYDFLYRIVDQNDITFFNKETGEDYVIGDELINYYEGTTGRIADGFNYEKKGIKKGSKTKCGRCNKLGHNRRTCKA